MSTERYSAWVNMLHDRVEQLRIVFVQLGSANEPARRALIASRLRVYSIDDYMANNEPPSVGATLVIDEVENLAGTRSSNQMGPLREQVFRDVELGTRVVLLSRSPRIAFPPVVGSSLLDDASFVHAPAVTGTGSEDFPTCAEDGADPETTLKRVLQELGAELCSSLDRVVYENLLAGQEALGLLSARELEALDGAGITAHSGIHREWNFTRHLQSLKRGLDDVLSDALEPQLQLGAVSSGLWKIERIIRREVRRRAIAAWSDRWRTECLKGDLADKVLDRATEAAYLGANSVKQLRNPLEWLTLGELLGLKERSEIGSLGLNSALWRQFSAQIMPIRNRLAHMRTLRPEDAAEVVRWQRILELRIPKV